MPFAVADQYLLPIYEPKLFLSVHIVLSSADDGSLQSLWPNQPPEAFNVVSQAAVAVQAIVAPLEHPRPSLQAATSILPIITVSTLGVMVGVGVVVGVFVGVCVGVRVGVFVGVGVMVGVGGGVIVGVGVTLVPI